MTNLKLTLNTLLALFIFALATNTSLAQKVLKTPYEIGINSSENGIVIKSDQNHVSQFLLINKDQQLLGGFHSREFGTGLVDNNGEFFIRHMSGIATNFMSPVEGKPKVHMSVLNDGRVAIGNIGKRNPMIQKKGGGVYAKDPQTGEVTYNQDSEDISVENFRLFVQTGILTEKVKVAGLQTDDWADYVFEEDYEMLPIEELEKYVKENKHLPNVPSAQEVADNGLDLAKTDATLLEKIEESYLYIIELNKKFEALEAENNHLKAGLKALQTGQN